jgi:hypothetical protein
LFTTQVAGKVIVDYQKLFLGSWLTTRIPQRLFDTFLLAFAAIAALRLIGLV